MVTVEEFCAHCDTMQDIWRKSLSEGVSLHPYEVRAGKKGITPLFVCQDYAGVRILPDSFNEGLPEGEFILPFHGSVMYSTERAEGY